MSPSFTFPFRDRDFNSLQFDSVPTIPQKTRDGSGNIIFRAHSVRARPNGVSRRNRPFGRAVDSAGGWALERKIPRGGNKARAGFVVLPRGVGDREGGQ